MNISWSQSNNNTFSHSVKISEKSPRKPQPKSPSPQTTTSNLKISYWATKQRKPAPTQRISYYEQKQNCQEYFQKNSTEQRKNLQATLKQKQLTMFNKSNRKTSPSQAMKKVTPKNTTSHMQRINEMIEQARANHSKMVRKIQNMKRQKQQTQYKQIQKFKFNPQIAKRPRYSVNSKFQERMKCLNEAKTERISQMQQLSFESKFKECTFTPSLSVKSRQIIEKKQKLKTEVERDPDEFTGLDKVRTIYQSKTPKTKREGFNFNFKVAKNLIHSYLKKLQLK